MSTNERQSNIELLRIFAMLGIVCLHYNNPAIGGGFEYVKYGSINYYSLCFFESMFIGSVDLFIIISAYFLASTKKRNLWRPIQLLVQVIIFSVLKYCCRGIINSNFSAYDLFFSIIPANYYVILYIVVFLISPYINLVFENLSSLQRKRFIISLLIIFSIYPTMVDVLIEVTKHDFKGLSSIGMYGSQYGYSIVNFILCYCIGAYIFFESKRIEQISTNVFIVSFFLCIIVLTCWSVINDRIGYNIEKSAWEYCNPLVIISAVCAFLMFHKIKVKKSKVINSLAKGSFTVYLLHINLVTHVGVKSVVNLSILLLIGHMIVSAVLIYLICWFLYLIYVKFEERVFSPLQVKHKLVFEI